eukprot:Gb_07538 [translate_table: standard]
MRLLRHSSIVCGCDASLRASVSCVNERPNGQLQGERGRPSAGQSGPHGCHAVAFTLPGQGSVGQRKERGGMEVVLDCRLPGLEWGGHSCVMEAATLMPMREL